MVMKSGIGRMGGGDYDYGMSAQQTKDGGYVLLSSSSNFDSYAPYEGGEILRPSARLIKTDSNGDEEWIKKFGGVELFDVEGNFPEELIFIEDYSSIQQTSDGGYIFTASKPIGNYFEDGHDDAVLVKIEPETSTPGFEIHTGLASAALIAAVLVFRRKRE